MRLESASPPLPVISERCAKAGGWWPSALEDLALEGGVGDVVLAADHVGDAEIGVVHHRGEGG